MTAHVPRGWAVECSDSQERGYWHHQLLVLVSYAISAARRCQALCVCRPQFQQIVILRTRGKACPAGIMSGMSINPTLLLVHGSWHGAWTWETVAPQLVSSGWYVRTAELPSVARTRSPRCGMYDDAEVIRQQVQQINGPVVIVSHSYGGIPVSEAAAGLLNVRHIIYVAAFLLDIGESPVSVLNGAMPPWFRVDGDVSFPINPREIFYADVPHDVADRAIARLWPSSVAAAEELLTAAAWRSIPSTYVVCEDDRAIPRASQELMAARASQVKYLTSGHSPFFSRPSELTQLIVEVASTVTNG